MLSKVPVRYPVMLRHRRHHSSRRTHERPKAGGANISWGDFSSQGRPDQRKTSNVRAISTLWNLTSKVEAQEALYVCLNVLWIHSF